MSKLFLKIFRFSLKKKKKRGITRSNQLIDYVCLCNLKFSHLMSQLLVIEMLYGNNKSLIELGLCYGISLIGVFPHIFVWYRRVSQLMTRVCTLNNWLNHTSILFFFCLKALKCQELTHLNNIVYDLLCTTNDFISIFFDFINKISIHQKEMASMILWKLWKRRNPKLWEGTNTPPLSTVLWQKKLSKNGAICKKQGNRTRIRAKMLYGQNLLLSW